MMEIKLMTKNLLLIIILTLCEVIPCSPKISDKRLCYDPECSVPVSEASTLMNYRSNDKDILSFPANVNVKVFSKEAGKRQDLWGVEIRGVRGYVPRKMIREKRLFHSDLKHEVPTENVASENISKDHENDEKLSPQIPTIIDAKSGIVTPIPPVSPSFEVIDGTTIDFSSDNRSPEDESYATQIRYSPSTEQPILSVHPIVASSELPITDDKLEGTVGLDIEGHAVDDAGANVLNEVEDVEDKEIKVENDKIEVKDEIVKAEDGKIEAKNEEVDEELEEKLIKETLLPSNIVETEPIKSAITEDSAIKIIDEETEVVDEKNEEVIETSETTPTVEEPKEEGGVLSNAFHAVTSIFESSTTPSPATIESVDENDEDEDEDEEASSEANSEEVASEETASDEIGESSMVLPSVTEAPVEVKVAGSTEATPVIIEDSSTILPNTTEAPVEDKVVSSTGATPVIVEDSSTILSNTTEAPVEDKVVSSTEATPVIVGEELTVTSEKKVMNETSSIIVEEKSIKIEEKIETTNGIESVKELHDETTLIIEKSGQPGIYENDGLSGSAKNIVNNVLNFNGFPGNRNLLNVESGRQINDHVIVMNEAPTPTPVESIPTLVESTPTQVESTSTPVESTPTQVESTPKSVHLPPPVKEASSTELPIELPTQAPLSVETEMQTKSLTPPEEEIKIEDVKVSEQIDAPEVNILEKPPISAPVEETKEKTEVEVPLPQVCEADSSCPDSKPTVQMPNEEEEKEEEKEEGAPFYDTAMMDVIYFGKNYWGTLSYAALTAFTTLLFSLGYYYIENSRRDSQFIAKINKLEKELLVSTKECTALDETLKSTKNKLTSIEDESFGSNEMVVSLKADLEIANKSKAELEDQVASLEKDLEGATEAGLELERMLREILASNSAENPLAKSVEDLQTRLNAQQTANESLTNALQMRIQENETLSRDLAIMTQKCEQLDVEVTRITEELKEERELRRNNERTSSAKVEELEKQIKHMSAEKINLRTQLRGKEMEMNDLLEIVKQDNKNNIDYDKLADISHVKAEASQLAEERDELKIKLSEVEGAHQLLEEHMKVINEEVVSLSEQAKLAEKEKKEAETRLEVLSNFFKEREAERQKEEAAWLQQQGEVSTTVERLQTMHNEILSYKQQIESLKREILDQEKEYKTQITSLEAKAHEQWVLARQNERRLEEAKAEAGQLRNRLTMTEKNFSDTESDVKIHRMETNGEPVTSPLFLGAEASSSPIMFSNTSGPPPPPPSYLYGPPLPPYMPPPLPPPGLPPYDVSQRPPPLGGRLASPPPMPPIPPNSGRYDNPGSPPPLSPPLIYGHRNYPPNPYGNERIPPPLPPWSGTDDLLPSSRNAGFHPFHRDQQRTREHKGSLHSSGESLDKSHHSGKV